MTTVNLHQLVEAFPNYQEPDRVRNDVLGLSKHFKTFVPKRGSIDLDSRRAEVLTLNGTFSMVFRGTEYHTPIQIYITDNYPASAPVCYILPSQGMSLRVGHNNVDQSGLVSLPYLEQWDPSSNLIDLVDNLSSVFGAEPPLCSTPTSSAPESEATKTKKHGNLQVMCPAYGRTGTLSMKRALEILGFGPCYHMTSVTENLLHHPQLWLDAFRGRGLAVHEVLDGYKSAADFPAALFYREILAANPDAKVILTLRDPDSWWRSFSTNIHSKSKGMTSWGLNFWEVFVPGVITLTEMDVCLKPCRMNEADAKADYARHIKEVKEHVGAEMLEFSVKEGWEPLCKFLDVPVPDVPFPRVNSTEEFTAYVNRKNFQGWLIMATAMTIAGASVAAASVFGGKRAGCALATAEIAVLASRFRKAAVAKRDK